MMSYPVRSLVIEKGVPSQRRFAAQAAAQVTTSDRVVFEVVDEGLLIQGITEFDIEQAYTAIASKFSQLEQKKPHVNFIFDGNGRLLQEPYYRISVDTPDDMTGNVTGDLSSRRASVISVEDSRLGKTVKAEIPVCECFGYGTSLRMLTQGRGRYELEFIGYKPTPRDPDGGDAIYVR